MTERALSPNEQRLRDAQTEKNALRKLYTASKRAETARMVEHYSGACETLRRIVNAIRRMDERGGPVIVDLVRQSRIPSEPDELRAFALSTISRALMRRREALGLPPFDDPVALPPDQPKRNAYTAIRDLLS